MKETKYDKVIKKVFFSKYRENQRVVRFEREDLERACTDLNIGKILNLGDIPYSYRFRKNLPKEIREKAPAGLEWIIVGAGIALYEFRLAKPAKLTPSRHRQKIKILDATPEIVKKYASGIDEQAFLTRIRYNRLIDLFCGLTCYSIQNHLRTVVEGIGQIEVDEIYLGVSKKGGHYVIPCQAKSPGDQFGIVQVMQDIELCKQRYPKAVCRPMAIQFLSEEELAILELSVEEVDEIYHFSIVEEKHYHLVRQSEISDDEIHLYLQKDES